MGLMVNNMGLLMLAGLIGSAIYGTYCAKHEATALVADTNIRPTMSSDRNKEIINRHFELICKRGDVELDKNENPLYEKHYNCLCAYLQYQGFDKESVDYFVDLYLAKYNHSKNKLIEKFKKKHQDIIKQCNSSEKKFITYRHNYSGNTKERMKEIMKNELWKKLVLGYNYVDDGWKDVEIWNLYIPVNIEKDIGNIYNEVCFLQGLYKSNKRFKNEV